ncbi:succinate dehydrogenase assembly factor 2 [Ectothiorhodospiraceae bacterium WFHF3C12]|nr:succinate dehydrogenase assembly factor 2 [Ectothiorhodospiraceae bacterium WFHF3C12]
MSRLRWKCRRGTKELDAILGAFLRNGAETLTAEELAVFDQLLDEQDDLLTDYFFGRQEPRDGAQRALVERILAHARP